MYEAFFNLKNKPFSLLPDPEFLFLSSRHAIGLSLLDYSLTGQAGFCVITGEIGSGKTTLVRAFLSKVGRDFTVGLISNTHQALRDIAAWALAAFGQKATGSHPAETYQELMAYLIAEYGAGRQCILVVDEAQNLSIEVLEELRLLSNINSGKDLLLQVVLVGQPELLEKLKRPELSQFAQRIAISHHLTPLPYAETRRYIEHRVKVAGSDRPLFTEMAMGAVQYFSGGIPRLVNSICDMALVYGFAEDKRLITEDLVFRVVSDRQMSGIAPFAQSGLADDPSVRVEIMKLTNLEPPEASDAPKPETAAEIPADETIGTDIKAPEIPPQVVAPIQDKSPLVPQRAPGWDTPFSQDVAIKTRGRSNPYFFREAEDDEELLLTAEMNDSPLNAHKVMPVAERMPAPAAAPLNDTPTPVPVHISGADPAEARAPNQTHTEEESSRAIVDPMPWPSINERRASAPIPTKEDGTGTPPRRSWWRRSIGRSS